jgi:hypothetical protein
MTSEWRHNRGWRLVIGSAVATCFVLAACSGPTWEDNLDRAGGGNLSPETLTPEAVTGDGESGPARPSQSSRSAPRPPGRLSWHEGHAAVARKIEQSYRGDRNKPLRIAVVDFGNARGIACALGVSLAEAISSDLFPAKSFALVERRLLDRVLKENAISHTQLMDPSTSARLGKLAGVAGIVSGTITVSDREFGVNARLIDTETGTVLANAAVVIDRTDAEQIARCDDGSSGAGGHSADGEARAAPRAEASAAKPIGDFFYEDFSAIAEGELPQGWSGDDSLMVKSSGRARSLVKVGGDWHDAFAVIPGVRLPENFQIEVDGDLGTKGTDSAIVLEFGTLALRFNYDGNLLRSRATMLDISANVNSAGRTVFALQKRGSVLSVLVNGSSILVKRVSNLTIPSTLRIGVNQYARVYRVRGFSL